MTPEKAVKYIRMSVFLICMWPPLRSKSKIIFKLFMCFSVIVALGLFFPMIYSVVYFIDDMVIVLKSIVCSAVIINFLIKFSIVRIYHKKFEKLEAALNEFILNASDSSILIDKSWKFQFLMVCGWYFAAVGIVLGSLVLPQKFPSDAVYPFSVEHPLVPESLLRISALRGCELSIERICAGASNNIKRYYCKFADELIPPIRALAYTTVSLTKILMITSGFFLISDEILPVKIQFGIVAISLTFNTFLYSWAADHLVNIPLSNEIGGLKMCVLIIHRTQNPVL
ncbi:GSCOCT00002940001.3-RA-CDS, partial [Cotesia congregata]